MGLAMPRNGSWLVTPHVRGFIGVLIEQGQTKEPPLDVETLDITTRSDSFAVHGKALRCGGKIRHHWTFESLPDHDVVFSERLVAVRQVTLARAETGTMGIGREFGSDEITLQSQGIQRRFDRRAGAEDELVDFPAGRLVVDGRFTYQWSGQGTVSYRRRSRPARVRGAPGGYGQIEDQLCVRHIQHPASFSPGQVIAEGRLRVCMDPR
jgi:hypothetical protein